MKRMAEHDPCHGLYLYGQNQLSVLIELITELPQLEKLADAYASAEEEYMPSGPPMSPLTPSYFTSWGAFDLCAGGAKKETLGTVAIDLVKYLRIDEGLIAIFESMPEQELLERIRFPRSLSPSKYRFDRGSKALQLLCKLQVPRLVDLFVAYGPTFLVFASVSAGYIQTMRERWRLYDR